MKFSPCHKDGKGGDSPSHLLRKGDLRNIISEKTPSVNHLFSRNLASHYIL